VLGFGQIADLGGAGVRRRDFASLLGGTIFWPLGAAAQQSERVRRVSVLRGTAANDPFSRAMVLAFEQALERLGWTKGRNVQIDYRFASGDAGNLRRHAAEMAALAPDVLVAVGPALAPLLEATRTVPIVFVFAADPVGSGFIDSMSRPGGNATGFMLFSFSLNAKWLHILKEAAPAISRAAVLRDPVGSAGVGQFAVIQSVADLAGVEVSPINPHSAGEIERAVAAFVRAGGGGLIVTATALANVHRDLIVGLAARHKLPAIYYERSFVERGGLISYGTNLIDQFRLAAGYVDRILKGEKPAAMPVQAPTKYELVINLKTAKAIGLSVPDTVLARADEAIE
jgi:putative ABC transport system substrate-binding protein